ncbi:MAG TPA: ribose 5-phosphate isomerase B [Paludibacteraceae bacterium]|nr:ribose 5-phosphate isomerase B [Paludibacteraceae bacterium]HOL00618.1 ribose 5-phosphate isomerase B [Paludibacteraceae bacterium]
MKPLTELKIAICSDHAGYELKNELIEYLKIKNLAALKDFGTYSAESCDYPDYAHPLATAVENGDFDFGIALCASGNGVNITVNKHKGIRGALCWMSEIAFLARKHNDANVISLPAHFISQEEAKKMIDIFLTTDFEGGRHQRRIEKILC